MAHRAPAGPGALQSSAHLVLAAATDPRNRPLVDVGPDDFLISEAGAARELLSVRIADYPIVVAVDTRADASADFPQIQQAARHFIERLGADRPVVVGTLGRSPKTIATFDDSRTIVLERFGALTPDAPGDRPRLLTGIAAAANALRAAQSLFSAVVVLSSAPGETAGSGEDDPVPAIIASSAIVHAIVNQRGGAGGIRELRALVAQTRGELTPIYSASSYLAAVDRLADRLLSELLIEYISPTGSKATDVKVGIRVPGARVRGLGVAPR
ncbi:MAG TPA: hypothetical protein VGY57_04710 [Vicinamibacterales bacterium]|nr:hypothetical protein [Vicinamibacterales bacterium]